MKKVIVFLAAISILTISACASPLSWNGSSNPGPSSTDNLFDNANQVVKGSLQLMEMGTNDLCGGCGTASLSIVTKGVAPDPYFDIYTNYTKPFVFNCSTWLGSGSADANMDLSNHTQIRISVLTGQTNMQFVHTLIGGNVLFHSFRLQNMTDTVNGSLFGTFTNLNNVAGGNSTLTITLDGNLSSGSRVLSLHFESYTVFSGTNVVSESFSNCSVNGTDWAPQLN
jgi:hypothetical protein